MVRVLQAKLRSSTTKETPEHVVEILLDTIVGIDKELCTLGADFIGDSHQIGARLDEVVKLFRQKFITLLHFFELFGRHEIHRTERRERALVGSQKFTDFRERLANIVHARLER